MFDHLVSSFPLAIGLRMHGCEQTTFVYQLRAHLLVLLIIKLPSIVSDQYVGYPEATNYVSPYKIAGLCFSDSGQSFYLNRTKKTGARVIIRGNDQE